MAVHHLAFATRDLAATDAFYREVMGFELVKAVAAPTPDGGWAKHVFYDTGDGSLIAFWDLHDPAIGDTWSPAISTGLGLPAWVNHLAFDAPSLADLDARKRRWLETGHDVMEVDHGFCRSVYTNDPNGILVEFCSTTAPFTADDADVAARVLAEPAPALEAPPPASFHRADRLAERPASG